MNTRPYPIKHALEFCRKVHRRLPALQGAMWAVALYQDNEVVGVAIVGRPAARMLDDGQRLEVRRVAVIEGVSNGCSMLYGACSRAAKAMGASDLLTYIHADEVGTSLKASSWVESTKESATPAEWDRPSRARKQAADPVPKRRFFAPWSDWLRNAA